MSKIEEAKESVYNITQRLVEYLIEKDNLSPMNIKYNLQEAIIRAIDDYLMKNHWKVEFDSPMGKDSASILMMLGLIAEWNGESNCRGTTTVYLPKDNITKEEAKNIDKLINTLSNISKNTELNDLFDKYSVVAVMNKSD